MISFDHLIEYEWNLFINHVSKYYPITPELLYKYESEFVWGQISNNRAIVWNRDLLDRYKDRFTWWTFTPAANFHWEVEDIKRYKGYIDLNWLGRNKYFKVTEALLEKPPRKKFKVIENNIYLTDEMKAKYPERIGVHYEYHEKILPKDEVIRNIRYYDSSPQLSLYKHLLEEHLDDNTLDVILGKKMNHTQKYYYIGRNKHLLTYYHLPSQVKNHALAESEAYEEEIKQMLDNPDKKVTIRGSVSDGKKIIPELISIDTSSDLYLVSEHLCELLSYFGDFVFYEVDVIHRDLIVDSKFYAVSFNYTSLDLLIDYTKAEYKAYIYEAYNIRSHSKQIELSCRSREEFWEQRSDLRKVSKLKVSLHTHPIDVHSDILMKSTSLLVSEFLKEALEQVFPDHFRFASATGLNIKIPDKEYLETKKKYEKIDWRSLDIGHTTTTLDKEFIHYKKKRNRLKKAKADIPQSEFSNDEYRDTEVRLNLCISQEIKERIKKKLPEGYELLPIQGFYIQNEYAEDRPETVYSLIVATNGMGDELGFILERERDYTYSSRLVEFLHEIGDYEYID